MTSMQRQVLKKLARYSPTAIFVFMGKIRLRHSAPKVYTLTSELFLDQNSIRFLNSVASKTYKGC